MLRKRVKSVAWLTASAAGLLLAAGAVAQSAEQYDQYSEQEELLHQQDERMKAERKGTAMTSFNELDSDEDGFVSWEDLEKEHRDKLSKADWDQQMVMEQFDTDGDQQLSEEEYDSFQTALFARNSEAMAGGTGGESGSQEIDSSLLSMSVEEITDSAVVNSRGEEIGSVKSLVRDETKGTLSLVVESGGVLGIGANSIVVDLGDVSQMSDKQLLWDTMMSRDDIAEMPEFDDSQYTEISELDSTISEVKESG